MIGAWLCRNLVIFATTRVDDCQTFSKIKSTFVHTGHLIWWNNVHGSNLIWCGVHWRCLWMLCKVSVIWLELSPFEMRSPSDGLNHLIASSSLISVSLLCCVSRMGQKSSVSSSSLGMEQVSVPNICDHSSQRKWGRSSFSMVMVLKQSSQITFHRGVASLVEWFHTQESWKNVNH